MEKILIDKAIKFLRELKRKITYQYKNIERIGKNKVYYCNALTGNAVYDICINSDMTVSCNCQDYDGSGVIGDLSKQSLGEIFSGARAQHFRKKLAEGKLPIQTCARCVQLKLTNKDNADSYLKSYSTPIGIMVENTVLCNLMCLSCDREIVNRIRRKKKMDFADMVRVANTIKDYGIKRIVFFNLGEPFLSNTIYEELKIIREINPTLRIDVSTNGILIDSDEKRKAAMMVDYIYFSIHGPSQKVVTKYQRNGNFQKAYSNMRELIEYRNSQNLNYPLINWKYVLFNWNDKKPYIYKVIELAREAKVDFLSFWPTTSPAYGISWRYFISPYFRNIGVKLPHAREIDFRKERSNQRA